MALSYTPHYGKGKGSNVGVESDRECVLFVAPLVNGTNSHISFEKNIVEEVILEKSKDQFLYYIR